MVGAPPPAVGADGRDPGAEPPQGTQRDVIVIGASAGGVQALQALVAQLPAGLEAAVFVVLHLMPDGTSVLDSILDRAGPLPAGQACDGDRLERGRVFVAPPDFHLLPRGSSIHLSSGPRENGHRPAIDALFRAAARAYGPRVIGVVLTGTQDDGADGLRLIKERRGATVVQDPEDAAYGDMPSNAIRRVGPDRIVRLSEMGSVLTGLVDAPPRLEPSSLDQDTAAA